MSGPADFAVAFIRRCNFDSMVYLEAAYTRVEAYHVESAFSKIPPSRPEGHESGSREAVRAFIQAR
jgi:hypothetical protein